MNYIAYHVKIVFQFPDRSIITAEAELRISLNESFQEIIDSIRYAAFSPDQVDTARVFSYEMRVLG